MMDIKAVKEILFVEAITACNLASSTMKRMIVVKNLQLQIVNQTQHCFQVPYWSLLQVRLFGKKRYPELVLGQRCSGRNYQSRRCCTPENPCEEGEGDCDGPGDGGGHDGHKGCKGDLECGSNNCIKFGAYFHAKDDCCEKPLLGRNNNIIFIFNGQLLFPDGWGSWEAWSQCSKGCGVGKWSRTRNCTGPSCRHKHQSQERFCNTQPCGPRI